MLSATVSMLELHSHHADIIHTQCEGKPIARHFTSTNRLVQDMTVMVIDKLASNTITRKLREKTRIRKLKTFELFSLNIRNDAL